jgi:CheY-like chemotaxis protein
MWSDAPSQTLVSERDVLIVEDELTTRNALSALLANLGFVTHAVGSAELALARLDAGEHPEIALVDLDLPGMNGADFITILLARQPGVFSVLITAAEPDRVANVLAKGVPHMRKPLDFKELLKVLDRRGRSV